MSKIERVGQKVEQSICHLFWGFLRIEVNKVSKFFIHQKIAQKMFKCQKIVKISTIIKSIFQGPQSHNKYSWLYTYASFLVCENDSKDDNFLSS